MNFEIPVGMIVAYTGRVVPNGWLACDGSLVSRDTFKALYSSIGKVYGDGTRLPVSTCPICEVDSRLASTTCADIPSTA